MGNGRKQYSAEYKIKLQFPVHPPTIAQNSTFGRVSYTKDETIALHLA